MSILAGETGEEKMGTADDFESSVKDEKFPTDVPDVEADGYIEKGTLKLPKFNVSQEEIFQNFQDGRRRLRFKQGSPAQQYMSKTRYRIPFYVSWTDEKGRTYSKKVK